MGKSVFSVPIFFIVFRETLEAAIIVSVLLGLVEQIVKESDGTALGLVEPNVQGELDNVEQEAKQHAQSDTASSTQQDSDVSAPELLVEPDRDLAMKRLMRKMRLQIFFWCCSRPNHRSCYRCCFHRRLVHPSVPTCGQVRRDCGKVGRTHATQKKALCSPVLPCRYFLGHRSDHHLRHGCYHAQDGPRKSKVAHQATQRFLWKACVCHYANRHIVWQLTCHFFHSQA